jgi:hypothetical protein
MVTLYNSVQHRKHLLVKIEDVLTLEDVKQSIHFASDYFVQCKHKIILVFDFTDSVSFEDKSVINLLANFTETYKDKIECTKLSGISGIKKIYYNLYIALKPKPYKRYVYTTYQELVTATKIEFRKDFKKIFITEVEVVN